MDPPVTPTPTEPPTLDALLPPAMARRAEQVGAAKAALPADRLLVLAVLAGVFIGIGGLLSAVATTGELPYGVSRVLGGAVFSLGLVLVVVGGAELFTGNTLIVMAVASRQVRVSAFARSLALSFLGNAVGSIVLAGAVVAGGVHEQGDGAVGARLLAIGRAKTTLEPGRAFVLGVLANVLVCLAVWMSFSARSVIDRVVAVIGPVTAFVALGFEHSIANLFLVPVALFVRDRATPEIWAATGAGPSAFDELTWAGFITDNLLPVTLGNLVGGSVLVGLVYWFVYLRARPG